MIRERGSRWQVDVTVGGKRIRKSAASFLIAQELERSLLEAKAIAHNKALSAPSNLPNTFALFQEELMQFSIGFFLESTQAANDEVMAECFNKGPTMSDMLELTWNKYWKLNNDGAESKRVSGKVLDEMGWLDSSPSEIQERELAELGDFYRNLGNSPSTIKKKTFAMTKLLNTAVEEGIIDKPPSLVFLKERNVKVGFLSVKEEELMLFWLLELGYIKSWHLACFLIDTGVKLVEAIKLTSNNVDHIEKVVRYEGTQSYDVRCIPLTDRAMNSALKWEDLSDKEFNSDLKEACRYSNMDYADQNTLRHTYINRMIQAGIALPIVMQSLGCNSVCEPEGHENLNLK